MSMETEPSPGDPITPDEHLIAVHKLKISEVLKELFEIVQEVNFNPTDTQYIGILRAKYDQLEELYNQLTVYETVMSRVQEYHLGKRESYRFCASLPAFGKRCEIDGFIEKFDPSNRFLLVQGQTGSGKSTQLPQYIADHPRMAGKKVVCTQPRKIAAISLAERVNLEYAYGNTKSKVGYQVGYSIGGSKAKILKGTTRIEYMTEGKMLERLINRRKEDFKNIGAIIIDEAHERSIICDILLGTLKQYDSLWNDILIVVSSATIDLVAFDEYFEGRAKIIEIPGRMYPVERIYKPLSVGSGDLADQGDIVRVVAETALEIHRSEKIGDILCFLPGADEVHRGALWFENNIFVSTADMPAAKVYELYGAQDAEEQRKIFEELDPKVYRKVIFATDIAETSITINGVVYVVDSGVKKEITFDPKRNISSLKTINISQSSSLQREGRAGRTQPGVCYKLYSEEDFQRMNVNTLPEIFRRPLPLAILYLRKMGINPVDFDWISAPDPEAIESAEEELIILGAIDPTSKQPTTLGWLISYSQQEPKTVRMIYSGMLKGFGAAAIKIAALLSVSSSFFYHGGKRADLETKTKLNEKRKSLQQEDGDILTMFKLYAKYESLTESDAKPEIKRIRSEWIVNNSMNGKALKTADSIVRDLKYIFSNIALWCQKESQDLIPNDLEVLQLFCSGYFLHAARRVNINGKGQSRINYFAIEPEVIGSLHYKASIGNGDGDKGVPEWIIFDQIMKFSEITVFPSSSRIDFSWIQNESKEFYNKCIVKQRILPTEVVEITASDTVLRTVLGKRLVNLSRFEEELNCSIIVDLSTGLLRAFCSPIFFTNVDIFLKTEMERAKEVINNETLELTWRANNRLVIGPGYEVTSVLFPKEFNSIYIRNLDRDYTRKQLEEYVYFKIGNPSKVSSIQLIPQDRSNLGIVKLVEFSDAAWLLTVMKDEVNSKGRDISIVPYMGDVSPGTAPRSADVKFKISWPLGPSTGVANIIVQTCRDGNQIVDMLPMYFSGAIPNAVGDLNLTDLTSKKPKVCKERGGRFKFCDDTIYSVQPVYKVKVKGLSEGVDEFQIIEQLKKLSITPLRVFIERKEVEDDGLSLLTVAEQREAKLALFRATCIGCDRDVVATDFFDKAGGRAGVFIYHPNNLAMEKIFPELRDEYSKMTTYGQPYRVELERLFTFSVHMDLYQCLKSKFKKALGEFRKWGVWVSEAGPGTGNERNQAVEKKSKFVYIKLRHGDSEMIRRCRLTLEEIMERESLDPQSSPNVGNLFTWTGRLLMKEHVPTSTDYHIYWDNRNRRIDIYGKDPASRNFVVEKLNVIIDLIGKWKQAGFFEVVLMLDRRTFESVQRKKPDFIDSLCQHFKFAKGQYHLSRNKLVISTSRAADLKKFQRCLEARGIKMLEKKPSVTRDCGVCFCEVDSDFIVTSICNHAFCMGCIQNMFASAAGVQKIPLTCPVDQCERRLPIQDIMKAIPPQAISKLNETALDIYLQNSSLKYCPKPGCNQIFRPDKTGKFYSCDHCLSDFCLDCTEFLRKEVGAHPGRRCEDVRITEDNQLWKFVNQIRDEILNLRCPRCKSVFYDFDGCAAVFCENCKASFCGLCLEDCGTDAHAHVANCPYNKTKVLHVDMISVQEANRVYRINKLTQFFRNSSDLQSAVKSKILNALSCDLKDLNINVTDIQ